MLAGCGPRVPLAQNPAAQLGAALGTLGPAGRDKITLLYAPQLQSLGTWIEQLISESTGKLGKGLVPLCGEPKPGLAAASGERLYVELQLGSRIDRNVEQLGREAEAAGHPVVRIHWQDAYDLGGEVIRWFIATTIAGSLMDINPFDEPNVREAKEFTKSFVDQYVREQGFPRPRPLAAGDGIELYDGAANAGAVSQGLGAWLGRLRPRDYIAVLSFLPRTPQGDAFVAGLRERFARLEVPTMMGFGPRYLHSTGQLYKGGPDGGLFLLLTSDEPQDLPIPGEPYNFGVLKQAQALGDFQAMKQLGRRLLRVHLKDPSQATFTRALQVVEQACASVRSSPAAPKSSTR
jgi:hypothetical protein